jgi:integrase
LSRQHRCRRCHRRTGSAASTATCGPAPSTRKRTAAAVARVNNRGPLTATGIYQIVARRGRRCGVTVYPHRFRHHFIHTWLDRGGAEQDLMELNGWTSPQMLTCCGASARGPRARRSYDRIMDDST